MEQFSSNEDINKLIGYFEGNINLKNPYGMNKLKKLIKENPSSTELFDFGKYLYSKILETNKNILLLEKTLMNDTYKKQERRLNIYRSIKNCNFDVAVVYWSTLLGLTEGCTSFYDYIKSIGMYCDLNNKNEFYLKISEFVNEEKFDFNTLNSIMNKNAEAYPSEQQIKNNYRIIKNKVKNYTCEIGKFGELISYRYSKDELRSLGKDDLASRVIWVARDIGDHFGFDQTSFDENEEELILEVKATDSKKFEYEKDNFYMTQNEFQQMKKMKEEYNYLVVRVYVDDKGNGNLFYLKPNDDMSVEYGDIKYVTNGKILPGRTTYEYKRVPKKKVYKLED